MIDSRSLINFHRKYYHPENVVLSICSPLPFEFFKRLAEKFPVARKGKFVKRVTDKKPYYKPQTRSRTTDYVQCHAILGNLAYKYSDKKRISLILLANMLGGPGMNSRLGIAIREKKGYTYHVESGYVPYSDVGLFHCYFSTDLKYLYKSIDIMQKEFAKLRKSSLGSLQLHRAITQLKGQLLLSEENKSSLMLMMGKSKVQDQPLENLERVIRQIENVNALQMLDVANEILDPDKLSSLLFLPGES
jgi:predicted Zn-dependent peptidase